MSMTVFFILWDGIEHKYQEYTQKRNHQNEVSHRNRHHQYRDANNFIVDCGKSTTGLFFGILVLLITIIALITYFIYKDHNQIAAVTLSELIEFFLLLISLLTVIIIFFKLKFYKFKTKFERSMNYNSILVIIGLAGKSFL